MLPRPIFMTPAGGDLHRRFFNYFKKLEADVDRDIVMHISADDLLHGNVAQVHEKIIVLQHYPHLIKRFLCGVSLEFEMPKEKKKQGDKSVFVHPLLAAWFSRLMLLPAVPFFIKEDLYRLTAAAGDLLASGSFQASMSPGLSGVDIRMDSDQLNVITDRMFIGARFLQLFCYGSGYDPQPEADRILESFGLILRYDMVRENLEADLAHNRSTENGKFQFN